MHVGNPLNFAWSEICIFKIRGKYPLEYSLHPSDNTIHPFTRGTSGAKPLAAPSATVLHQTKYFLENYVYYLSFGTRGEGAAAAVAENGWNQYQNFTW